MIEMQIIAFDEVPKTCPVRCPYVPLHPDRLGLSDPCCLRAGFSLTLVTMPACLILARFLPGSPHSISVLLQPVKYPLVRLRHSHKRSLSKVSRVCLSNSQKLVSGSLYLGLKTVLHAFTYSKLLQKLQSIDVHTTVKPSSLPRCKSPGLPGLGSN